jgi:hypothetical protein
VRSITGATFSGLHEVAQNIQISFGQLRDVKDKLLIGKVGEESVPKISPNSAQRSRMNSGSADSGEHANAVRP